MTRIVLCEGFHDRAFLAGLFQEHLGLTEHRWSPTGTPLNQGQFGYKTPSGEIVIVKPCHGKEKILPAARTVADRLPTDPVELLVLCSDDDQTTSVTDCQTRSAARNQALRAEISQLQADNPTATFKLDVESITWACSSTLSHIPQSQCLERLVACALSTAYATRGTSVANWLAGRPEQPADGEAKANMWAHMAGWFSAHGCDTFLRMLWSDPQVAPVLKQLLAHDWAVIERIAS